MAFRPALIRIMPETVLHGLNSELSMWSLLPYLALASLIALVGYFLSVRYRTGLRLIPGPLLASFSDLDRIISTAKGLCMNYHIQLHEQYGPLVRIGPKHVSFSDPSYIPVLYGINSKFWKSDFYKPFDGEIQASPCTPLWPRLNQNVVKTPAGTRPTIFSVRDEHWHRDIRRPVANAYALSTLKELEPMNDACSEVLTRKLDKYAGQDIDLGKWVHVSLRVQGMVSNQTERAPVVRLRCDYINNLLQHLGNDGARTRHWTHHRIH